MSVSDAQFLQYLRRGNAGAGVPLVTLAEIEFAYQTGSGPATGTIYLSDHRYRTKSTDSPASVRYHDVIEAAPDFERSIDLKKLGGRGSMSAGSLALNNADGAVDFLRDVIIDGREVRFYVGADGWARADFRLVNVAVVESVGAPNDLQMVLGLRDKNYLLDDTIIGDAIGAGPNAGKPRPILLGFVKNFDITPYLLGGGGATALRYYFNNFALDFTTDVSYLTDVRDAGVSLRTDQLFTFNSGSMSADTATDTLTYTSAHGLAADDVIVIGTLLPGALFTGLSADTQYWVISAGLTANDFRLSLSKGGAAVDITGTVLTGTWSVSRRRYYVTASAATIDLSSSPAGRVTIDVQGLDAAGAVGISAEPHKAFKYLLANYTRLDASEYDSTAIDALASDEQSTIFYGRAILDRMNVLELLDEIALATYSWYGWNAAGVLTVGRLDLPNLDAVTSIDSIDVHDIDGDLSWENLPLPWGKILMNADRNVVVQTDGLASSVSAENRSKWGQAFQTRVSTTDPGTTSYTANWWDYHKSAIDSKPLITVSATNTPGSTVAAQWLCDELTDQFKPLVCAFRCTVGLDKYALNPGDCVTLTYPRYGLDAGVKVRVVSVRTRVSDQRVDLVLVRQVTPDYTSTSHP